MKSMNKFITGLALLCLPAFCFSQNYWEVGLAAGASVYYGDLTVPAVTFKETHLAGQISLKRYFNGEHAIRLNVLHGTFSGDDNNFKSLSSRGNKFVGKFTEFAFMGELDLKGRRRFSKKKGYQKTASPYIMVGLSGIYSNPDVTYGQPDSKDKGVNYPSWHFGIPIGGGYKFDINERITVGAELGLRLTLSDYLDGTQASGNAYKNDAFLFSGITAGYRFVKGKRKRVVSIG